MWPVTSSINDHIIATVESVWKAMDNDLWWITWTLSSEIQERVAMIESSVKDHVRELTRSSWEELNG